jgi:phosphatidate cytidylyltransferase
VPPKKPGSGVPPQAWVKRLLTAAVGIPVLFLVIKQGPVWICFALVSTCAALAAREACLLLATTGRRPSTGLAMAGSVLVAAPFLGERGTLVLPFSNLEITPALILIGLVGAALFVSAIGRDLPRAVEGAIATLFVIVFVGLPLGYLTGLRAMDDEEMGRDLLVLLLAIIWVGDTAAMYAGRVLGRHKLAPRISPGKSIEGAVAGVLAGAGAAWAAHIWWFRRLPLEHALIIGVILGVVGIAGDLAESILKRAAGAKDSSSILPGHGGMLDRIDSLLFAGPALYYYYQAWLQSPS